MAGIGFELRKLLKKESFTGLFQAYLFAGVIGSGPWIISILAMLLINFLSLNTIYLPELIAQFQVTVTWLIAFSLVFTGGLQLYFTRYIADRLFEHQPTRVLPGLHATVLASFAISLPMVVAFLVLTFDDIPVLYQLLIVTTFALLCLVWLLTVLLTGLKQYKTIVLIYFLGYGSMLALNPWFAQWGKEGLLASFMLGQTILVLGMSALVWKEYPSPQLIDFDVFKKGRGFPSLLATGFCFNFGVWIDKIIFWLGPTGSPVLGGLRASPIYDSPIFLAYLTIIPGMAVFIMRIETDFAEAYDRFYQTVRSGGALSTILHLQQEMTFNARESIFDIIKVQTITALAIIASGPALLKLVGLDPLYTPLFHVNVIGVGIQVILIGALNILFYLDKRLEVLIVSAVLALLNTGLTLFTLQIGPELYGYGFVGAMLGATVVALKMIDKELRELSYKTFMMST